MKLSNGQSFSPTDLSTNHTYNTGIVFPLASAANQPNFAGILHHRGPGAGNTSIARFEYRVADGAIDAETGTSITYHKGRCVSYIAGPDSTVSIAELIMGELSTNTAYGTVDSLTTAQVNSSPLQALFDAWDTAELLPMTDFITPDNVATKKYVAPVYKHSTQHTHYKAPTLDLNPLEDYEAIGRAIKWIDPLTLAKMSLPQLAKATAELSNYYYGIDDDEPYGTASYSISDYIDEYNFLQKMIKSELAESAEETEDEEDAYMRSRLLGIGITSFALSTMSANQVATTFEANFPHA